ncbi:MAG: DUF1566 domain-containing protein [Chloroflexota bacterium]
MSGRNFISGIEVGRTLPLATGRTTCYAARDDGDLQKGIPKPTARYQINTTGPFSGTTAVYLPTLARNDIAFVNATSKITAAAGLNVVKTGDVIRIRGSASNDTEYTVATGGVATEIVLTSAPVNEGAGAWITIAKQALHSNNTVLDLNTKLLWLRYGTYSPAKLGAASDGKLLWTATAVTIHAANNDLQMIASGQGSATLRIVGGAGEVLRYWPGYTYSFTGFANAVNNLPGFRCVSVTVNGADLDIVLDTGNQTCIAEAAGGARAINLSCNGIFGFANACNEAAVGGYSDWRVPNIFEYLCLLNLSQADHIPDPTAFPSWVGGSIYHSSTTISSTPASDLALYTRAGLNLTYYAPKTSAYYVILLRGGI